MTDELSDLLSLRKQMVINYIDCEDEKITSLYLRIIHTVDDFVNELEEK